MIERVNAVDNDQYRKEFPELFTGLGRMKNDYTIRLQETLNHSQPQLLVDYLF